MMLEIGPHHCSRGKRNNAFFNPLAIALAEKLRDPHVTVTKRCIHSTRYGIVTLAPSSREWLNRWDECQTASPTSLYVAIDA